MWPQTCTVATWTICFGSCLLFSVVWLLLMASVTLGRQIAVTISGHGSEPGATSSPGHARLNLPNPKQNTATETSHVYSPGHTRAEPHTPLHSIRRQKVVTSIVRDIRGPNLTHRAQCTTAEFVPETNRENRQLSNTFMIRAGDQIRIDTQEIWDRGGWMRSSWVRGCTLPHICSLYARLNRVNLLRWIAILILQHYIFGLFKIKKINCRDIYKPNCFLCASYIHTKRPASKMRFVHISMHIKN